MEKGRTIDAASASATNVPASRVREAAADDRVRRMSSTDALWITAVSGCSGTRRASPAAERNNRPHGFNKLEGPRTLQESVGGSECARHGERQDKQRIPIFEGVAINIVVTANRPNAESAVMPVRTARREPGACRMAPSPRATFARRAVDAQIESQEPQHCRSASIMPAINGNVSRSVPPISQRR
jgi:hypothetical protein